MLRWADPHPQLQMIFFDRDIGLDCSPHFTSICIQVGSSALSRVLSRLKQLHQEKADNASSSDQNTDIVIGLDSPDDAALVRWELSN